MKHLRSYEDRNRNFLTQGVQRKTVREETSFIMTVIPDQGSPFIRQSFVVDWQMQISEKKEFNDQNANDLKTGINIH